MSDTATQSNTITYFQSNNPGHTLIPVVKALITRPREFFAGMPVTGFYGNSLFFASIIIAGLSLLSVPDYSLGMLLMMPLLWGAILIGMWILAGYISWAMKAFTGTRLTQANAFQLSSYAMLPMLFVGLFWFGIAAFLGSVYLFWLGLVAHCRISAGRAAAVLIIPVLLVAILGGGTVFSLAQLH